MKLFNLRNISKDYFNYRDIANEMGISDASARVTANRYVKNGILIRIKRDIYVLKEKWDHFDREKQFDIANLMQVPSYISLISALDYYEITTQMQRNFIESVVVKRSKEVTICDVYFNFTKLNKNLYFGFEKVRNFFIATPEKAMLDACYLMSLGRYKFDFSSITVDVLNVKVLKEFLRKYPLKTQNLVKKNGLI